MNTWKKIIKNIKKKYESLSLGIVHKNLFSKKNKERYYKKYPIVIVQENPNLVTMSLDPIDWDHKIKTGFIMVDERVYERIPKSLLKVIYDHEIGHILHDDMIGDNKSPINKEYLADENAVKYHGKEKVLESLIWLENEGSKIFRKIHRITEETWNVFHKEIYNKEISLRKENLNK